MKTKNRSKSVPSIRRTSVRPARVETMEPRVLMSGYGFSSVLALSDTGLPSNSSTVARDSADNLYGTTTTGGLNNAGMVYEVAKGSGKVTKVASFSGVPGTTTTFGGSNLVIDSAGNLYGANSSSIFEVVKGSGKITILAPSDSGDASPSDLIVDSHGNLFGTSDDGSVFELAKGSHTTTILANLANDGDADINLSSLAIDSSGDLFGTTQREFGTAISNVTTVFEVVKGSGVITTLVSYTGDAAISAPIVDSSGNLYGTVNPGLFTGGHGSANSTVFEIARGSGKFTTLATFSGQVGLSALVRNASGDLFGTVEVQDNGSVPPNSVFEVAHGSGKVTTLAAFASGVTPSALTLDSGGNLYGTTSEGTNTVFEVVSGSGKISTLATFGGLTNPTGLARDSAGNLYGVASQDGADVYSIFEVAAATDTMTRLATINPGSQSVVPSALFVDASGNLFGTLSPNSANSGNSTLFEVVKGSGKVTTRLTFNGTVTAGSLVSDANGNLYGTLNPGTGANSTVFKVAKGSTKATTLATFSGNVAPSGLVIDPAGNVYGTTAAEVFEVAAGSGKITKLASFAAGGIPSALSLDSSGDLFGTWVQPPDFFGSVSGPSTVFEVVKGSGKIKTLASFDIGVFPNAVVVDSSGNLFGTTENFGSGSADDGAVFEVAKGSGKVSTVLAFGGATGLFPASSLIAGPGGTIFGTTSIGGPQGGGVIFKLTPD